MHLIERFEHNGRTIDIVPDDDPIDPLNEHEGIGKFVAFHRRYKLGCPHDYRFDDYHSWEELETAIVKRENPVVILPVFLYDHSGLYLKVGSFQGLLPQGHAEWDSGQVGFMFISRDDAIKTYNTKRFTKQVKEDITNALTMEIDVYSHYLNGEVYGFAIHEGDKDSDVVDACYGFFYLDECREQAKEMVDALVSQNE